MNFVSSGFLGLAVNLALQYSILSYSCHSKIYYYHYKMKQYCYVNMQYVVNE